MTFFFNDINANLELYTLEVSIGNNTQRQHIQLSPEMVAMQFMQLVEEISRYKSPARFKISQTQEIWSQIDKNFRPVERAVEFKNTAWERMEEEA